MTQAEKRSLEAYPKSDFQRVENRRRGERSHYIKGYEQAVKDFTEKAVQWPDPEPVPLLTPEILERNGFHLGFTSDEEDAMSQLGMTAEKGWVWDEGGGSVKVMFPDKPDKSDGGMVIISDQNFNMYMVFYFNEIYVHELQYMIRLCKVDKKIELL